MKCVKIDYDNIIVRLDRKYIEIYFNYNIPNQVIYLQKLYRLLRYYERKPIRFVNAKDIVIINNVVYYELDVYFFNCNILSIYNVCGGYLYIKDETRSNVGEVYSSFHKDTSEYILPKGDIHVQTYLGNISI